VLCQLPREFKGGDCRRRKYTPATIGGVRYVTVDVIVCVNGALRAKTRFVSGRAFGRAGYTETRAALAAGTFQAEAGRG